MNTNQMINNYTKEMQKQIADALKITTPNLGIKIEPFIKAASEELANQQLMLKKAATVSYKELFSGFNKALKLYVDTNQFNNTITKMEKIHTKFINLRCENIEILGKYGWSIFSTSFIREFSFWEDIPFSFPKELKKMEESEEVTIGDIDNYFAESLMKRLSKEKKEEIKDKFTKRTKDKKKIDNLFDDFINEKYYECASTLFGLIDSEIIKTNLKDYHKNEYSEELYKKDGKPIIDQGWAAFSITFKNNFKSFFNSETFAAHKEQKTENGIKTTWSKEMLFDKFVNNVKKEMDKNISYEFLNIAYPLLILFNDNDWLDYPKKPKVINRNWLAHGMYDYDDVTKSDCIKLFLVYYQLIYFLETDWAAIIEDSETESTTS